MRGSGRIASEPTNYEQGTTKKSCLKQDKEVRTQKHPMLSSDHHSAMYMLWNTCIHTLHTHTDTGMCPYTYTYVCAHTHIYTHTYICSPTYENESNTNTKDKMGIIYVKTKEIFKRLIHLRTLSTKYFLLSFCGGLQKTFMHGNGLDFL